MKTYRLVLIYQKDHSPIWHLKFNPEDQQDTAFEVSGNFLQEVILEAIKNIEDDGYSEILDVLANPDKYIKL